MKLVQPKAYLVAGPQIFGAGVASYLKDLEEQYGGDPMRWWDRVVSDGASAGEILVELMGRLCYRSFDTGMNPNVTQVREDSAEYFRNILKSGHGSVIEHPNYSFILFNVSRVFTHEQVRHRVGVAYSQESMRFVRLTDIPFWFPDWAKADRELFQRCVDVIAILEEHQRWMTQHFKLDDPRTAFSEKKAKTSFMRRFAPDGVATAIGCTINVRSVRHIIYMRTALSAEEEIRLVMDAIAEEMLRLVPNLMQDYNPNEDREWIPEFLKV